MTRRPWLFGPSPETSMTRRVGLDAALVEQLHAEIDRARDRGALRPAQGRRGDLVGEGQDALRVVEDRPGHDDLLVVGAGPFEIGDGDPAEHAAPDRVVHQRRPERLGEALALQRLLLGIHRVGDVDREHEREIDLGLGARPAAARGQAQDSPAGETVEATPNHRGLLELTRRSVPASEGRATACRSALPHLEARRTRDRGGTR